MTSRVLFRHALPLTATTALVAAFLAITMGAAPASADSPYNTCTNLQVLGHRGYTQLSPTTEDTIEAWLRAAGNGAAVVEGDLRTTSDGRWVLMHDSTVDRTTDGSGAVAGKSYYALTRLHMADGHQAYVSLTNLVTLVHRAHPSVGFQLELKGGVSAASVRVLGEQLRELGVASQTTITSFEPSYLTTFRTVNPGFRLGLISDDAVPLDTAMAYHLVVVNGAAGGLTRAYVDALHARGREVESWWPGQTIDAWHKLVLLGVDGYIANDTGLARAWCTQARAA